MTMRRVLFLLFLALILLAALIHWEARRAEVRLEEAAQAAAQAAAGDESSVEEYVTLSIDARCIGRDGAVIRDYALPIPAGRLPAEALRDGAFLAAEYVCRSAGAGALERVVMMRPTGYRSPGTMGEAEARRAAEVDLARRLPGAEITAWRRLWGPGWAQVTVRWRGRQVTAEAEAPHWLVGDRLRAGFVATRAANQRLHVETPTYQEALKQYWDDVVKQIKGDG